MSFEIRFCREDTWPEYIEMEIPSEDEVKTYIPERTCKFFPFSCDKEKPRYEQEGTCSECHELMYGTDNYCSQCGAHVEKGDNND